jgi:hypothetical protein
MSPRGARWGVWHRSLENGEGGGGGGCRQKGVGGQVRPGCMVYVGRVWRSAATATTTTTNNNANDYHYHYPIYGGTYYVLCYDYYTLLLQQLQKRRPYK